MYCTKMLNKQSIIDSLSDFVTKERLNSFQIKHLWLAGSYNMGHENKESDIDFIYEKDISISFENRWPLGAYVFLKKKFGRDIDIMKKENIKENIRSSVLSSATQIW